jgi:hypothetical protein
MYKTIGRRLVVNLNGRAFAMEILAGSPADYGVPDDSPYGLHSILQDVREYDGLIAYKNIQENPTPYGLPFTDLIGVSHHWQTDAEQERSRVP